MPGFFGGMSQYIFRVALEACSIRSGNRVRLRIIHAEKKKRREFVK